MSSCFIIKIYDTQDPEAVTIIERTSKSGPFLTYNGGEEKDTVMISSSLDFNMLDENYQDGRFFELYTGDESRYRVELIKKQLQDGEEVEILYWKGYLLPEQYSEPYTNNTFFVSFSASCGIGRLKGKFLPDSYYNDDNSVVGIIAKCLGFTSNEGDIYLTPAIVNSSNSNWHEIFLDGRSFLNGAEKLDCYEILELILKDTLCCIYHEYGNWFIMGINKRPIKRLEYKKYNFFGEYIEDVLITRKSIDIKKQAFLTPNISVVSPLKKVEVSYKKAVTEVSGNVFKETTDGWVLTGQAFAFYNPSDLFFNNFIPNPNTDNTSWITVSTGNRKLVLYDVQPYDETQYVYLRNKIFVTEGQRLRLTANFTLTRSGIDPDTSDDQVSQNGIWDGLLKFAIVVDDFTGQNNIQESVYFFDFDRNRKSENIYDLVVAKSGFLDIRLWQPIGNEVQETVGFITVDDIKIEEVNYQENIVIDNVVNDDFSIEKPFELTLKDDLNSTINLFSFDKERVRDVFLYSREIDIRSVFIYNEVDYVSVDPYDIFDIRDYPDLVFLRKNGTTEWILLQGVNIIYNFLGSDQNVITYDAIDGGLKIEADDDLRVDIYGYTYTPGDKKSWQQWYDSVYSVNQKRYAYVVADIYRRLYKEPHVEIDFQLKGIYGISSLISFNYRGDRDFYPLNVSLNLAEGITSGKYSQAYYGEDEVVVLPISVDAGTDRFFYNSITSGSLNAVVVTPNSFIVDVLWEVVVGSADLTSTNTLDTNYTNASKIVEFKVTVTDNYGQIATDTVKHVRVQEYSLDMVELFSIVNDTSSSQDRSTIYDLIWSPELVNDIALIKLNFEIFMENSLSGYCAADIEVFKNNVSVLKKGYTKPPTGSSQVSSSTRNEVLDLQVVPGDQVRVVLYVFSELRVITGSAKSQVASYINSVIFQDGTGLVTNLIEFRFDSVTID